MEKTIFSIDKPYDLYTVSKFNRHLDTLRAMGKLKGEVEMCIGKWEGKLEPSYRVLTVDFEKHVLPSGYLDGQKCFMRISSDLRQPAILDWRGVREALKPISVGNGSEQFFTYVIKDDVYLVA
jgi:hypothetical protein